MMGEIFFTLACGDLLIDIGATSIIITAMLGLASQLAAAAPTAGHDLTAPITARADGDLERRLAPVVTWSNDKQSTASVQCTTDKTYQNIFLYTSGEHVQWSQSHTMF